MRPICIDESYSTLGRLIAVGAAAPPKTGRRSAGGPRLAAASGGLKRKDGHRRKCRIQDRQRDVGSGENMLTAGHRNPPTTGAWASKHNYLGGKSTDA